MRSPLRRPFVPGILAALLAVGCGGDSPQAAPGDGGEGGVRAGVGYDPKQDPLVNPASLLEPYDAAKATEEDWLLCTLDGNPSTLNPLFGSSQYEFILNGFLFDGPFTFDAAMEWKTNDSMTESLEESADHKVWTLRLKPGLKWQDGQPFTAHDIAYSWREILDDRVPCPAVKPGTDEIELCEAVDDRTVRFVHKSPLPTAKWNVQFPILPKHVYEKGKAEDPTLKNSAFYAKVNREPVGNGPYRFVEWKENDKIVLERWEEFHGPKPHFKRIVCRIIPDNNVALLSFEKGETDEVRLTSKQFADETVRSKSFNEVGVKAWAPQWQFSYICWNADGSNPFFGDVRVRRAMTHSTNIPLIIEQLGYNLSTPCYGIFHPDARWFNPEVKLLPFDLDAAARLLDEAGWKIDSETGWRQKGDTKFSFTLTISQGSTMAAAWAAIVQQDLKSIGVELKTQILEWATFQERNRKHEFQASTAAWGTGTDPDTLWNIWHSEEYKAGRNYGGFKNARVDELFALARHEFDPEKRRTHYQEIQKIVYDEQPYTFLWNTPTLWAFSKRIRGVIYSPRGVWNFDPSFMAWWVPRGEQAYGSK